MEPIRITNNRGKILAHHTTESQLSRYSQPVWIVEEEECLEDVIIWKQGDNEIKMDCFGVIGGWLVVEQPNGILAGIIWTDGTYYSGNIINRDTQDVVTEDTLDDLGSGMFMVDGAICWSNIDESPLGSLLG